LTGLTDKEVALNLRKDFEFGLLDNGGTVKTLGILRDELNDLAFSSTQDAYEPLGARSLSMKPAQAHALNAWAPTGGAILGF
jgi:hypothetical protein